MVPARQEKTRIASLLDEIGVPAAEIALPRWASMSETIRAVVA